MRVLTEEDLQLMRLFEQSTGAVLKDCVRDETLTFVVEEGIQKAIGAGGSRVRVLQQKLRKPVRIVQWNDDRDQFIKNVFAPHQIAGITEENGSIILKAPDYKTRGMLIGRNASTLRQNETIIRRFFNVAEIKVVG